MRCVLVTLLLIGLAAGACSDDPTASEEYEALEQDLAAAQAQLDNVVSELDATKEALVTTEAALLAEGSSTTGLGRGLRGDCPSQTRSAALLLGYFAGADRAMVTGQQWWDKTWAGVVARDGAVGNIDDPALTELYWEYIGGDVGDPIEEVATNAFALRLIELTIEPCLQER